MFFQSVETERLLLKNIGADDRDFILKQFSDDDVNAFLFDAEPMRSVEEADALIAFYTAPEPRAQHRWVIVDKRSGEKIGTCGFHCWNDREKSVEVGYDLQRDFWGQGLMTEAMNAILGVYAPQMHITRVYAHIAEGNAASIRLAQKLGFRWAGETQTLCFHGQERLHRIYVFDTDAVRG